LLHCSRSRPSPPASCVAQAEPHSFLHWFFKMASHHNFCKFQKISHAATYNLINTRNRCSCLVFVDLRRSPQPPFPGAILPPPCTPDGASDLSALLLCLRSQLSGQQTAQSRIVLFIEELRIPSIENDMSVRCRGGAEADPDLTLLAMRWKKFCCVDIHHLFQYVPSQFIAAALMGGQACRVPSLIECLLPRALFLCEQKLVPQALNPTSGLGLSCVFNVTTNPPVHSPDITFSFPIEDAVECDIEAGALQTLLRPSHIFFNTVPPCSLRANAAAAAAAPAPQRPRARALRRRRQ
jgi:hypothetical protein